MKAKRVLHCFIRNRDGLSLLEVFAAVTILGIALTSIHYGQMQGIRAQARMQNVMQAAQKANELALRSFTNPDELPMLGETDEVTFAPPFDFFQGTRRVEQSDILPGINEVYLTVSWEPGARTGGRPTPGKGNASQSVELCFYKTAQLPTVQ